MIGSKMRIDPHVHCRDGKQNYKTTITRVFEIAGRQSVDIIFDMPNTDPPIVLPLNVARRLALVPQEKLDKYFLWMGLTSNSDQIESAVRCHENEPRVIGFKLYAGESVGDLAVTEIEEQFGIYKNLASLGYEGVLAVHCERKDLLKTELWDFHNPISHSWTRPKEAEIEAVENQIDFVRKSGFKGTLHIVHISCPESVALVGEARKSGINITCGVTPHHLLYVDEIQSGHSAGLMYKMNPPLRRLEDVEALRYCLLRGEIDWIETDHAPHAVGEKLFSPHLSGFPSLFLYRELVEKFLPKVGASKELIEAMTFGNIVKTFGKKLAEIGGE